METQSHCSWRLSGRYSLKSNYTTLAVTWHNSSSDRLRKSNTKTTIVCSSIASGMLKVGTTKPTVCKACQADAGTICQSPEHQLPASISADNGGDLTVSIRLEALYLYQSTTAIVIMWVTVSGTPWHILQVGLTLRCRMLGARSTESNSLVLSRPIQCYPDTSLI